MAIVEIQEFISDPKSLKDIFGSTPNLIGDIPIDVILSETPIHEWDITQHKVDAGLDVTDSRYKRPVGVTLDCILTNPEFSVTNIASKFISGGNPFTEATAKEKKEALEELADRNAFIGVTTPDNEYVSMMIKSISPILDKNKKNAYFYRITLMNVRTVSSTIVAVDDSQIPEDLKKKKKAGSDKKTSKKKKKGKLTAAQAKSKNQSILDKLIGKYI